MLEIKKIICSYDFLRTTWGSMEHHAKRIQLLFKMPILCGTSIEPEVFPLNQTDFAEKFYKAQSKNDKVDEKSWYKIFHEEPTEEVLELLKKEYANALVIFCELPPIIENAFIKLEIPYINLVFHPIRYMHDIFYGFVTNNKEIKNVLHKNKLGEHNLFNVANHQKSRYLYNVMATKIPENSLLLIGQVEQDRVLIKKDNSFASLLDYEDEIEHLYNTHEHIYFKPHPEGTATKVINYFKNKAKTTIIDGTNNLFETYKLLSHPAITKVAGLNSSVLVESYFFEKDYENFIDFTYNYFEKDFDNSRKDCFLINNETYFNPIFWHEIMENLCAQSFPQPQVSNFLNMPNLRLFLRGAGSFDDVTSFTQAKKTGELFSKQNELDTKINELEKLILQQKKQKGRENE